MQWEGFLDGAWYGTSNVSTSSGVGSPFVSAPTLHLPLGAFPRPTLVVAVCVETVNAPRQAAADRDEGSRT